MCFTADFAAARLGVLNGKQLCPTMLQHIVKERLMFHTSGQEALAAICSSGFDPRLWRSNRYGQVHGLISFQHSSAMLSPALQAAHLKSMRLHAGIYQ
jgi:hypothetical protein